MLKAFCETLSEVGLTKLLSISMDGPNVNWRFLTDLIKKREDEHMPQLLNVGSCGLHVIHGAVQTGHKASGWNLNETLKAAYYLFKDWIFSNSQVC